jgi:hypothetical protein
MKKQHPKDFEIVWVCTDCGTPSLLHTDIEEHKKANDHHHVSEFDLDTGTMIAQYTQQNN